MTRPRLPHAGGHKTAPRWRSYACHNCYNPHSKEVREDWPMTQTHRWQASRLHNASDDHAGWRRDVSETSHNCTERIWAHSVHSGNPTCSSKTRSATIVTGGDKRFPRPAMIATSGASAPSVHSGNPKHSANKLQWVETRMSPRPATIALDRTEPCSSVHSGNPSHTSTHLWRAR